jgi:hypothetical protein
VGGFDRAAERMRSASGPPPIDRPLSTINDILPKPENHKQLPSFSQFREQEVT